VCFLLHYLFRVSPLSVVARRTEDQALLNRSSPPCSHKSILLLYTRFILSVRSHTVSILTSLDIRPVRLVVKIRRLSILILKAEVQIVISLLLCEFRFYHLLLCLSCILPLDFSLEQISPCAVQVLVVLCLISVFSCLRRRPLPSL